jgi:hypothetical protein
VGAIGFSMLGSYACDSLVDASHYGDGGRAQDPVAVAGVIDATAFLLRMTRRTSPSAQFFRRRRNVGRLADIGATRSPPNVTQRWD